MNNLITGSLSQVAAQNNQSLAETFLSCDVLLLVDMSSSMGANDAKGNQSRYDVAEADVIRLQAKFKGKVALVVFSNEVMFCPTGKPIRLGGGTELNKALEYVKVADDCGIKIVVISDGEPWEPYKCLEIAKTFVSKIDTVYIGSESDVMGGREFLKELARVSEGKSIEGDNPGNLLEPVEKLMINE